MEGTGAVTHWPIHMALAVTAEGHRDILGFAAVGEGAKRWLRVLTELKSRGVGDVLMLVCDGLKSGRRGWPGPAWDRHANVRRPPLAGLVAPAVRRRTRPPKALKPVCTTPTEGVTTALSWNCERNGEGVSTAYRGARRM